MRKQCSVATTVALFTIVISVCVVREQILASGNPLERSAWLEKRNQNVSCIVDCANCGCEGRFLPENNECVCSCDVSVNATLDRACVENMQLSSNSSGYRYTIKTDTLNSVESSHNAHTRVRRQILAADYFRWIRHLRNIRRNEIAKLRQYISDYFTTTTAAPTTTTAATTTTTAATTTKTTAATTTTTTAATTTTTTAATTVGVTTTTTAAANSTTECITSFLLRVLDKIL
ncbi:uncharacterized protein LOC129723326 isoform X2 [Wyeomyia smithii]|uniref:uncharacterized protein LOC129723326 isoform X2 n=1 Tax=Wyeomyia smithii TaxID=174621 RepID=UPI002467F4BF|nr:uncharacterized protein LOC129723326 isoform X2 [Wyeomyia smithii]XP_055533474.1 uncharacterized protein LOC129723326 isoform X2 [Wyeomyia smithii]